MRKIGIIICLLGLGLATFFTIGFYSQSEKLENLIAVSWGDGKYGKALYGAYAFLVPRNDGQFSVQAEIKIGRGTPFVTTQHEVGELGVVSSNIEAVKRWGTISWTAKGVSFGDAASNGYFLPREKFENHR